MAQNLNVTELDFDQIKKNLKNFLKTQSEFNDYDFEGSGLSTLLDVLAYNTHYNAMNAHFSLNEAFLDSAQIRGNIVTRAKLLGYIPRSVLSPRATVNIVVDVTNEVGTVPSTLTLPRGTKLSTNVDGTEFRYVVLNEHQVSLNTDESTSPNTRTFTFNNVTVVEGTRKTLKYRVDNDIENQKFQLSDDDADTSTLRVLVQANEESSAFDNYTQFESLLNVNSTSKVYYLQENSNEYYEIYFGDGVTGNKPTNNNIVTLDYIFTQGSESNGAKTFTIVDNVGGFSNVTITTVAAATGGTEKETNESIRFNAPLTFTSQNRAVTSDDYRAIIQKSFSNIKSISCWGGEDNDPPDYGKVFISIKPLVGDNLTQSEKDNITGTILKGKNVVSITPTMVDPTFTFLELDVHFKYNPNLTDRSDVELQSVVRDTISDYNFNELEKFDGVFRHSKLTRAIDNADPSIQNSTVRPFMFMNITPANNAANNFELKFVEPFFRTGAPTDFTISSTSFTLNGETVFFGDTEITGSTNRKVIIYKVVNGVNVTVNNNAGLVDHEKGIITLNNFIPDTTASIRITVTPNSLDLAPLRNQLISIDPLRVTVTPIVDTISLSGSSGTIKYTTTSRLR
tara:strand:- start:3649 stop:5517 length:1869 start_codon:yes stop_codon:yes gene_type:complete